MKRMMGLFFACMMLFSSVTALADTDSSIPTSQVVYLTSTSTTSQTSSIYLSSISAKVTSPKSSKTSVASIYSLSNNTNVYKGYEYTYSDGTSRSATISLRLKKAGSATISYKIGSTTYKTKVTVKAYTNPVKKITLTNVNSGKNFSSKTKSNAYVYNNDSLSLSKTTSSAKLTLTAASGWKISSISVSDSIYTSDSSMSTSQYTSFYRSYSSGVSSVKDLNVGKLTKGRSHYLSVTFVNSSTGGTLTVSYSFS
ncbi:MAG: hypothetical protein LIP12_08930 [Clostridiales bacterium]|nr:hypothetical protein [Clostridiales bacterium]